MSGLSNQGRLGFYWVWKQQDHSPLRGLLTLQVRWGCGGWIDAPGLGEGPGWKCHWNRCKKRRGQAEACGSQQTPRGGCGAVLEESTQSQKGLAVRSSASLSVAIKLRVRA